MHLVGDLDPRGPQVSQRRRNPSLGQVVPRVVVEADDQDAPVAPANSPDQVVQVGEVLVVPRQYREILADGPRQHPGVRDRQEPDI